MPTPKNYSNTQNPNAMNKKIMLWLLFGLFVQTAIAQSRQISGTVVAAEDNGALPGVSIAIKGTSMGTVTDMDGKYSLSVPSDAQVLVFTYVGFLKKEITIGASNTINVIMEKDVKLMDEVVVTALGISREKRSLGYSVSNLKSEDVQRSGEQNVIESLNAKAPGIQVTSSAGVPGASSKVLIRGNASFSGQNQPLIVVDGVPIDNTTYTSSSRDYPFNANLSGVNNSNRAVDINPSDIESVTILKGPAASALYGARAGNGAIVYTTKRGGAGNRKGLGVTVSSTIEFSKVNKLPALQNRFAQGSGGNYITADAGPDNRHGTADDVADGTPQSWGPRIDTTNLQTFDNPGNFFKTGHSYVNNVEVTGGNDISSFRLSYGDLRQDGIVPNSSFTRNSLRLTADTRLSDKVRIGATANYIQSGGTKPQNGSNLSGVMLTLLRAPATFDLRDYEFANGNERSYYVIYDNPYYTAYNNPFTDKNNRIMGNAFVTYKANDWFDASYRIGADAYVENRKQIFAISSWGDDNGESTGQINENRLVSSQFYGDLLLNFHKNFGENFKTKLTVGNNFFIKNYSDLFSRGRYLSVPGFYNLSNAAELYSSSLQENLRTAAVFGDLSLEYKNFLFLNFTGRTEGASSFEVGKNTFFYPSASVAFAFTELMKSRPAWLSFGKVRYAYSQVAVNPEAYLTRTYFTSPFYTDGFTNGLSFPYQGVNGYGYSSILGNSDLKPERVIGNEVGLNLNLWQNLVDLDVTYYNQRSVDLLLKRPIAPSSGFEFDYSNTGEMVNKGLEIQLNVNPLRESKLTWSVAANWAQNRSKVTKLAPGVDELDIETAFSSIGAFAIVGQPFGAFYGTKWQRDDAGNLLIGANGRPLIDPKTGNIGNPNPDWLAGLRNTFAYKGVTLSFLFDFRKGGSIWNGTYARLNQIGRTEESADRERTYLIEGKYAPGTIVNGEDVSGQDNKTEVSALTYFRTYVGDGGGAAEQFVEKVNWVRLRDLNLSYRLPLQNKSIAYIDFKFTARNLWLSTNYKGVDPETSLTGAGSNIGGFDYFNNPGTKSYQFGVAFAF